MADVLPAGAPRVSPAKDSLALSYQRLTRDHQPRTSRVAVAAWGSFMLATGYIVAQVARALV